MRPPDKENCQPFVQVQGLMAAAGLNVPQILAFDEPPASCCCPTWATRP